MFALFVAPIPKNSFVCHHCDNRRCVRPDHLYSGTAKDNSSDIVARSPEVFRRGERARNVKLKEFQVFEIRAKSESRTIASLAREYSVSERCIEKVVKRMTWTHI